MKIVFEADLSGNVKISKWPTLLPVLSQKGRFDHKRVGISTFAEIS